MLQRMIGAQVVVCVCLFSLALAAQQPQTPAQQASAAAVAEPEAPRVVLQGESTASVLRLMKFSGQLRDRTGNARSGVVGLAIALYQDQQGGAPLWLELHNAQLDEQGRYTVLLGNTKSEGLPLELFSSGEARWLGVQLNLPGEEEQPRVLLVSVPYALKAADAETLGGKPPSAFLLAEKPEGREAAAAPAGTGKEALKDGPERQQVISGTVGRIAKFVGPNPDDLGNSDISEVSGDVGFGTTMPVAKVEIAGAGNSQLQITANTASPFPSLLGFTNLPSSAAKPDYYFRIAGNAANSPLVLEANGFGEVMSWTHGRFVGVGTANPGARLEVGGGGTQYVQITADTTNPFPSLLGFTNLQSRAVKPDYYFRIAGNAANSPLVLEANGIGDLMSWTQDRRVGIGTAAPSQKFEVNGNVKITGGGNGIIFPDATVQTTAGVGDITAVVASTGLIGGATSGAATLELSGGARARGITYLAGCDNCGVLGNNDDQKTFFQNVCDAVTINSITCFSDAGAPTINIQRQVGVAAPVNVLSPDLPCSTTGASGTIVGAQSVLSTGDKLDFVMVLADGVAKRVTIVIKTTMN